MNRIVFFVFFDQNGIVDAYVYHLVKSMKQYAQKVVIISNSEIVHEDKERLEKYTEFIIKRENIGFDAGAYKDVFTKYFACEKWEKWDEVILINDTIFGPIFSMDDVFHIMDKQSVDFWGMTKHEASKWSDGSIMKKHIQSYFVAFRKSVLLSNLFTEFWSQLAYPITLDDAVHNFECYMTSYFETRGFLSGVYTDFVEHGYIMEDDELVYDKYVYELVSVSKMPFIKRKALGPLNYTNANKTIEYVKNNTDYDVEMILSNIKRLDISGKLSYVGGYGYSRLKEFNNRLRNIYLYGNGKISRKLRQYYRAIEREISGIIVTNIDKNKDKNVIQMDSFFPTAEDGVVIATGSKYAEEIFCLLQSKMPIENILRPKL